LVKHKSIALLLVIMFLMTVFAIAPLEPARAEVYHRTVYSLQPVYRYIQYTQITPLYRWQWYYNWNYSAQPVPVPKPVPALPVVPTSKPEPVPEPQPKPQLPTQNRYQLSQYEQKVVDLVNAERNKAGLKPLAVDLELARVARIKAEDMRDNNYFSHQSPTYGSPFEMMQKFGIKYRTAGENIAAGQKTPEAVVAAWMSSEGHRRNILNAGFTHIGVGHATGGSYQDYWVQQFIGR